MGGENRNAHRSPAGGCSPVTVARLERCQADEDPALRAGTAGYSIIGLTALIAFAWWRAYSPPTSRRRTR
jgi:hypothetical protein